MVEVSNNLIASLLIVAIVISGLSVFVISTVIRVPITGFAGQGQGTANVSITGEISIVMLRNYTDFDGSALGGFDRIIDTQAVNYGTFDAGSEGNGTNQAGCDGTEANCAFPFVVENTGNTNISIDVNATSEASSWLWSDAGAYVMGKGNETYACNWSGEFGESNWIDLNQTTEARVCGNLGSSNDNIEGDSLRIHVRLLIPSDTIQGDYGTILTVGALSAPARP
jgi:hypothetical protein